MSAPPHSAPDAEPLDEALRDRILRDPGFVLNDPNLMRALLGVEAPRDRQIIDLRSVLIARLEKRLGRLREAHRDVVDAAWSSVAGAEQTQLAVLALLDAKSLQRFIEVLVIDVPEFMQADIARLCFEGAEARRAITFAGVSRRRRELAVIEQGGVSRRLPWSGSGATVRFRSGESVDSELFGDETQAVGSEALIALNLGDVAGMGLLAFGAKDPRRFDERQDADALMFLGQVVSRLLRGWLARIDGDS